MPGFLPYKIHRNQKKAVVELRCSSAAKERILKFLANKNFHVEIIRPKSELHSHLEIDYRAYQLLQASQNQLNLLCENPNEISSQDLAYATSQEREVERLLHDADLSHIEARVWKNQNKYYIKADHHLYSCTNFNDLAELIKGNYLIEGKKPITSLNYNPIKVFGIFGVATDALSSSKSILRTTKKDGKRVRKKEYKTLLKSDSNDGAVFGVDPTSKVVLGSSIPYQLAAVAQIVATVETHNHADLALQALALFPLIFRGFNLEHSDTGGELHEAENKYRLAAKKKAEIEVKLEDFRREVCDAAGLPYEQYRYEHPQILVRKVSEHLQNKDQETVDHVTEICLKYRNELLEDFQSTELRDVFAVYTGWLGITSVILSVGFDEAKTIMEALGAVEDNAEVAEMIETVGAGFGVAGQTLMALYALYRSREEFKEVAKIKEEIKEFNKCSNVSELAKTITNKLLEAKKNNHTVQAYGEATLAVGQTLLTIGGPLGLGISPITYAGIATIAGAMITKQVSDMRYRAAFETNARPDIIETMILSETPKFDENSFGNLNASITDHMQKQIFALEMLGHLRAPQYALYQKYLEQNSNDPNIFQQAYGLLGGDRFTKWLTTPPQDSVDFIRNNPLVNLDPYHPHDLNIFWVEQENVEFILELGNYVGELHNLKKDRFLNERKIHNILGKINDLRRQEYGNRIEDIEYTGESLESLHEIIVRKSQEDFIVKRKTEFLNKPKKTSIQLCQEILDHGGSAAVYLKRKLLRGVANDGLKYKNGVVAQESTVEKDGEIVRVKKFDINNFDEASLDRFLNEKRPKKLPAFGDKKPVLSKVAKIQKTDVKSEHLGPFKRLGTLGVHLHRFQKDTIAEEREERKTEVKETKKQKIAKKYTPKLIEIEAQDAATSLGEFIELAKKPAARNQVQRINDVDIQNALIEKVAEDEEDFVLAAPPENLSGNRTKFTYKDPNNPDSADHDIIYIRDNATGKIDILYGKKTNALIVENADANHNRNGMIAVIAKNQVRKYGDAEHSIYRTFTSLEPSVDVNPARGTNNLKYPNQAGLRNMGMPRSNG